MSRNKVTIYNITSTIILQGLTFISGPIFSSLLGTNNYGIAAVYLTWVQVASTVFSIQACSVIGVAKVNFSENEQKKYQSSVLSLASICYLVLSLFTIFFGWLFSHFFNISILMVIIGLLHGWGLYCVNAVNSIFTFEFKAGKNLVLSVVTSVLTIVISLLLISIFPEDTNYWGRIVGQSFVYTCIGVFLFFYVFSNGKVFFDSKYWKFTIPLALPTIFHLLAYIILNQCDKIMIQNMVDNSSAGIYSLACTFGAALNAIYIALNNSWTPYFYEFKKNNQNDKMLYHARNYRVLFTILTMGFILLSREVYHLYAHKSFWPGTEYLPVFAISSYFIYLYSFPVNFEYYNKKTKMIAIATVSASILNLILNYVLIKYVGIIGAVVATAISHGFQFGFHYVFSKKYIKEDVFPFKISDFIPGFLSVIVACVIFWVAKDYWIIRWSLGALLGIYLLIRIIRRREIF